MKGIRDYVYSDFSFPYCFSVHGSKEQCLICGGRLCFLLAPCVLAPAWLNQLTVIPCKTQRTNTRKSEKMPRKVSRFKFPLNSITYVSGKTLNSAGRLLSCFLEFKFHQMFLPRNSESSLTRQPRRKHRMLSFPPEFVLTPRK